MEAHTLVYTEKASLKIRVFNSKNKLSAFVGKFVLETLLNAEDNEILAVFSGYPAHYAAEIAVDDKEGIQP